MGNFPRSGKVSPEGGNFLEWGNIFLVARTGEYFPLSQEWGKFSPLQMGNIFPFSWGGENIPLYQEVFGENILLEMFFGNIFPEIFLRKIFLRFC